MIFLSRCACSCLIIPSLIKSQRSLLFIQLIVKTDLSAVIGLKASEYISVQSRNFTENLDRDGLVEFSES